MRIAVLGGGITGIAVARTLLERGYDPIVFEADSKIGGLCRSETHDGFVHDLSGGHIIHSRDRQIVDEMLSLLGPGGSVETIRDTKIFYRGEYVKYPFENGLADLPPSDRFDCVKGYIDAYIARRRSNDGGEGAPEPSNFRDWIRWRMGDGIARHFMYPYNEKLWSSDLRDVSTNWVSGRVPDAPYEDVLKSALGIETEGYTHQSVFYYPKTGGFETLVRRLAAPVVNRIRVSSPVRELAIDGDGRAEVNGESFDGAINSIPLQELYRSLRPAAPDDVQAAVDGLKYLSISTVLLAIDRDKLSPHSWIYLPHPENGPSNRITYLNNYSPDNAPDGKSSILAEVTAPGGTPAPDGEMLEREVAAAMVKNGFVKDDEILFTKSHSFRYAYPYYDVGFEARISVIRQHLADLGLASLGRFGAYRYINSDQVLLQVKEFFEDNYPELR